MKFSKFLASLIISYFFFSPLNLNAQISNTWIGGSPGHETDWNYYKNWSLNRVPDWTMDVIILDVSSSTHHYPEIFSGRFEVNSLLTSPQTKLRVSADASLAVLSEGKAWFRR